MNFIKNPWKMAEDAVFGALCKATQATPEKNAFLGVLPAVGNAWALKVGGGGDVGNTWTAPITELMMDADIDGVFLEREPAQEFGLKILNVLPIRRIANVQMMRLRSGGMVDVKVQEITVGNVDKVVNIWRVSIGMEIVFNTTDRPNVDPA